MEACVESVAPVTHVPDAPPDAHDVMQEESDGRSEYRSKDRPLQETAPPEKRSWFGANWLGFGKARAALRLGSGQAEKLPHIVHVDVDAFFASVEQVLNPKLRGKPVLVGRGCVASASYEAKFRGVKTAMSFRNALRICPKAIVVPGKYEHYADFAERVRRILETYTPAGGTAALDGFFPVVGGPRGRIPAFAGVRRAGP